MARRGKALTTRKVETAKPGKYEDGYGLRLVVAESGARKWVFRYMLAGKRVEMGLGSVPTVSLAEARQRAADARRLVKAGTRPSLGAARRACGSGGGRHLWSVCAEVARYNRGGLSECKAPRPVAKYPHDVRGTNLEQTARPHRDGRRACLPEADMDGEGGNGVTGARPDRARSRRRGRAWVAIEGQSRSVARSPRQPSSQAATACSPCCHALR